MLNANFHNKRRPRHRHVAHDAGLPAKVTTGLTHDGGDREADAHLSLEASDDVLRLQPLAGHQHLYRSEQRRRRPHTEQIASHGGDETRARRHTGLRRCCYDFDASVVT